MRLKKRIYNILTPSDKSHAGRGLDIFLMTLICLNVVCILLESVPAILKKHDRLFYYFDLFSVIIFSIEYVLRVWTANEAPGKRRFYGNLQYMVSAPGIIDLLAIVPFYLPFLGLDLRLLRVLRVIRLFRLFKLARYVAALTLITTVIKNKREELTVSLIFTLFILLITSSLMYFVEKEAQPDKFTSIPETMWWAIATLTTVGYGDVYPITAVGKILGGMIALTGIGVIALPVGILSAGYVEALEQRRKHPVCPHCGKEI